jgi:hypothetical protein
MLFVSNFKELQKNAKESFELTNDLNAFRTENKIIIANKNGEIIETFNDIFPTNNKRAKTQILKKLKTAEQTIIHYKKNDVWTCGFRENEARWVWYLNSEPKITTCFENVYNKDDLENKIYFYSARYGTNIINNIKKQGLEKVSKKINALILENSYISIKCSNCENNENYTIDDIVDENKLPNYNSNFVVCLNCDNLINLIK